MEKLTYSIEEFAQIMGVGRTTAYKAAGCGEIYTARVQGRRVVPKAVVDGLLNPSSQSIAASEEQQSSSAVRSRTHSKQELKQADIRPCKDHKEVSRSQDRD